MEAGRGILRLSWIDGVKVALETSGMTVKEKDRKKWRALVRMLIEFHAAILLVPTFFRNALPRSGGLSPGEGWDGVT